MAPRNAGTAMRMRGDQQLVNEPPRMVHQHLRWDPGNGGAGSAASIVKIGGSEVASGLIAKQARPKQGFRSQLVSGDGDRHTEVYRDG